MKAAPFVFIAALATTTALAFAYSETGPVQVTSCVVNGPIKDLSRVSFAFTNGVTVDVKNMSKKTATSVTVTGNYHGRVVTDTAKVNIAPGGTTRIERQYTPSVYIDNVATCHVTQVAFADGTEWHGPSH
jgi:hypothetical protein